jgi:hypothetical protein
LSGGLIEFFAQFGPFTGVTAFGSVLGHVFSDLWVHGAKDTKEMPREAMTVL